MPEAQDMLTRMPAPNLFLREMEEPMQRMRPRAIMEILSERKSLSSMLWVVSTIALPTLASSMIFHTCRLDMGSIPANDRR